MLAESPSLDGGALLVGLLILGLFLAAACGAVALGFVWARRAGRGSQPALAGWVVVALLEVGFGILAVFGGAPGLLVACVAVLGGQALWYRRGRAEGGG